MELDQEVRDTLEKLGLMDGGQGEGSGLATVTQTTLEGKLTGSLAAVVSNVENLEEAIEKIFKLEAALEDQQKKFQDERSKNEELEKRFLKLAANHEEIVRYRDQYKTENENLKIENLELKLENTRLYSDKLDAKDREIQRLQHTVDFLQKELSDSQHKLKKAADDARKLSNSYEEKITKLVQNLSIAEESLADTVFRLKEQEVVRSKVEKESRLTCHRLQQEKEELMQLAIERGRQITKTVDPFENSQKKTCTFFQSNQEELQRIVKELDVTKEQIKELSKQTYDSTLLEKRLQELESAHEAALEQIDIIKKIRNKTFTGVLAHLS